MRLRYRAVLYHIEDSEPLQHYYQQLVDEMVRQTPTARSYSRRNSVWRPPTDIHETPEAFLVRMELAGMSENEIDVTMYPDAIVVSGVRQDAQEHDEATNFHEAQIRYGPFEAAVRLPLPIDSDGAEARYDNGFLHLRLPKKQPERLRVRNGRAIEADEAAPTNPPLPETGETLS